MKNILFVTRHAPYGKSLAHEALDALLASSAYGQNLSVLFLDDAVFQLMNNQQADAIEAKSLSKVLAVLPIYDIENIYVSERGLQQRGLDNEPLSINCKTLNDADIRQLLTQQDCILSF